MMNWDQFAWNCFVNSGNPEAFLLYKQQQRLQEKGDDRNGAGQNRGDRPSGNEVR